MNKRTPEPICYIVFRADVPTFLGDDDGILWCGVMNSRSCRCYTVFMSREEAVDAIKATNRYDIEERMGWDEALGKLWILRGKLKGKL